jgi:hypothetical protein
MENEAVMPQYPYIVFTPYHDERSKEEMTPRDYVSHVCVVTKADQYYPVFFYDPVCLSQDLEESMKHGLYPFVAEPGLIVIPEVTLEAMTTAVEILYRDGYFDHLLPAPENPQPTFQSEVFLTQPRTADIAPRTNR